LFDIVLFNHSSVKNTTLKNLAFRILFFFAIIKISMSESGLTALNVKELQMKISDTNGSDLYNRQNLFIFSINGFMFSFFSFRANSLKLYDSSISNFLLNTKNSFCIGIGYHIIL
jgi:hypothetical protein